MSTEQIKTGLKLSEAVKLLEENEGALIKEQDMEYDFVRLDQISNLITKTRYDVKLPPPKTASVTVTRADVERAYMNSTECPKSSVLAKLCKELGL